MRVHPTPIRLLIVDDNAAMRRLISSMVADLAGDVRECADGQQAIAACRARTPDWVLMDVCMPVLDGIAATRLITAQWPAIKVVIVTDFDDDRLRHSARSAGASHYVVKGDLRVLRELLEQPPH